MLRNFKLIIFIITLGLSSICAYAQDDVVANLKEAAVEYKDVFLDGKPAKLNVATGQVTLVTLDTKTTKEGQKPNSQNQTASVNTSKASDFHIVKHNETLLDVSKRYGVSLSQLKQANNLESTLINKGQRLRIDNFDAVEMSEVSQSTSATNDDSDNDDSDYHIVASGETLFSLAKRYGLTLSELKRLNNLNSNLIRPNQELRLRGTAAEETTTASSVWVVQCGDNLYRIALNNGTTVEALKRLNGLTSNTIKIGQKLKLR